MKKLGQLLLDFGWIEGPQLEQALEAQRVVGGRIGTCLMEGGALDEPMLLRALAHQRAVPAARTVDLAMVPDEVVSLLSSRVALRCLAIPFRMLGPELFVAMLDVDNLDLHDEIAFATGKQVRIHIANEVRIFSGLHRYYGRELSDRYKLLESQLDRPTNGVRRQSGFGRHLGSDNASAAASVPTLTGDAGMQALDASAAELGPSLGQAVPATVTQEFATTHWGASADSDDGSTTSATITTPFLRRFESDEKFAEALERLDDREAMALLFAEHLRPHFRRLLLFKVLPGAAVGWVGTGTGVNQTKLESAEINLDQPSIFQDLKNGRAMHQGPLASLRAHQPVVAAFDGVAPATCLFAPVRLGSRLVSVVIGEPSASSDPAQAREQVKRACSALGKAFANYLLRQRTH